MRQGDTFPYMALNVVIVVMIGLGLFLMVGLSSRTRTIEYRIADAERIRAHALKTKKALIAEYAGLQSLGEAEARGLGLDFPDRERVFFVKRTGGEEPMTVSMRIKERGE